MLLVRTVNCKQPVYVFLPLASCLWCLHTRQESRVYHKTGQCEKEEKNLILSCIYSSWSVPVTPIVKKFYISFLTVNFIYKLYLNSLVLNLEIKFYSGVCLYSSFPHAVVLMVIKIYNASVSHQIQLCTPSHNPSHPISQLCKIRRVIIIIHINEEQNWDKTEMFLNSSNIIRLISVGPSTRTQFLWCHPFTSFASLCQHRMMCFSQNNPCSSPASCILS